MKKFLNIITKVIVGIFVFYLFFGFVVLPLGLKWGIQSQGTKFLKHTVKIRSVGFNPFLLNLRLKGFAILDQDKEILIGFDLVSVDVSFLGLFKKIYRVESINIDGVVVHVALLEDGKINLLALVPKELLEKSQSTNQPETQTTSESLAQPLPAVVVDKIIYKNGKVTFTDKSVSPNFITTIDDIHFEITGITTKPDCQAKIIFGATLDGKGVISTEAIVMPFMAPLAAEMTFNMNNYAMQVLTPYVGKYTGRQLQDGKFDLAMTYKIADNKLTASHKVLIQNFEFGQKVESKDALSLPFGLAIALLEDPQGKINIALPVKGDMSDPEFEYFHLIGQVAKNFFIKLVTKPFTFLASMMGGLESGTDELGFVRFIPGKSELSAEDQEKLKTLIKGLQERPKLYLEVNGSFDPEIDWKAIKTDIFYQDYTNLKKESTKTEMWVMQQLFERRFGIRDLWVLTKKYKLKDGTYDSDKLNEEIKHQLIENAPADKLALDVLAQTRAKVVYDFIIVAGFDGTRVKLGQNRSVQASMGQVPLEFTLTVFEDAASAAQ